MATDEQLISKEDHELNYVLKKWDKRQTQENRDYLSKKLDEFNALGKKFGYRKNFREDFYKYMDPMSAFE
ncbi:hypothetical protein KAJ27_20855 [bacterium]|nr:hypothetical protein [bacterium]